MLGRPGRIPGTRELIPHENYLLVYEAAQDAIWILPGSCGPSVAAASRLKKVCRDVTMNVLLSNGKVDMLKNSIRT